MNNTLVARWMAVACVLAAVLEAAGLSAADEPGDRRQSVMREQLARVVPTVPIFRRGAI